MTRLSKETCTKKHKHTPEPSGYVEWHVWAQKMGRTHKQIRCDGCGFLAIWVPRVSRKKKQ